MYTISHFQHTLNLMLQFKKLYVVYTTCNICKYMMNIKKKKKAIQMQDLMNLAFKAFATTETMSGFHYYFWDFQIFFLRKDQFYK